MSTSASAASSPEGQRLLPSRHLAHRGFPAGIDEKLDLSEPYVWDVDDFEGHDRMAVARGNTVLEKIYEQTRTQLPKLIASVRWSVMRMSYVEYANAAGMSANGYKSLEKDPKLVSGAHREKITKLLAFWEANGISAGVREQLLDLLLNPTLLELDESCVDLLSSIDHIREQSIQLIGAKELASFYHRVGYELGHDTVEQKFPSIYNTIWQREKTGTVPDCVELLNFVDTMYAGKSKQMTAQRTMRRAQAEAMWREARKNQYRERTLEDPLAVMLTAMEQHLARAHGTTMTAKSIGEGLRVGSLNSERLIQAELIDTADIAPVARKVMKRDEVDDLLQSWDEAFAVELERESFGRQCQDAMTKRGLTAADIGRLLDVKAPEERGKESKGRKQRYRPDAEVRSVLFHNHVSSQIPVEALIQIIAADDKHADTLREAYFQERERFFRRNGYRKEGEGLRMRIQRELANASMKTLATTFLPKKKHSDKAVVRQKDLELQRLERNEGGKKTIDFKQVFPVLKGMATQHSEAALDRLSGMDEIDESLKKFDTVEEMAVKLSKALKGADAVSEAMRYIAQRDSQWLRSDLITRMSEGNFVSALPSLRLMVKAALDQTLPDAVLRDWYERFPTQLEQGLIHFGTVKQPTAKAVSTIIATKDANPMDYFEHRVPGVLPTQGTKMLRSLEAGDDVEWKHIHKCLLAAGLMPQQSTYKYIKQLHASGGDVQATLRHIVPMLRLNGLEVHPLNLPGTTLKDLKGHRVKKNTK